MYLHLGEKTVIRTESIIGIFDMDNTTISKNTRNFLTRAEKNGEVINVSYELPKSFIVCIKNKERKVYISQIAANTLYKRINK
ncbi:MAG: extracellular matrix/biofilm biosynthesis regulator RemA family protein [Ruminococcus sp.]|nr:extracellular matrix/biofilm biosynthesis regulator RemA family protein [Ruminococcus sp.]